MVGEQKAEAQEALDELFSEHLLPFKLSANRVEPIGLQEFQEYIIHFHDSRLNAVIVSWYPGLSFKDVCRTAVLERVRLSETFALQDCPPANCKLGGPPPPSYNFGDGPVGLTSDITRRPR